MIIDKPQIIVPDDSGGGLEEVAYSPNALIDVFAAIKEILLDISETDSSVPPARMFMFKVRGCLEKVLTKKRCVTLKKNVLRMFFSL